VRVISLGSGSKGNATLVEFGRRRVLVDAGLSAKSLAQRLLAMGVEPASLEGVFLSHEHQDHARGAERFSRKHGVPVFSTVETLEAMDCSPVHFAQWHSLEPGRVIDMGWVRVDPFPVPHDAAGPVGFVLEGDALKVGIATDLGQATTLVVQRLRGCHMLMVESNHDDALLRDGPYPWQIKQRVGGRLGHLSNTEAADLVEKTVGDGCQAVLLAHLSESNNTPHLAQKAVREALVRRGHECVSLQVARTRSVTPPIVL